MNSEMNHHNHDGSDMWIDEYSFDYNAPTDMYKGLLDGACQSEDFSCMVDDGTTPVKACGDLPCHDNFIENTNRNLDRCNEGSLLLKRRRMLQFASEAAETSLCVEDMLRPTFLRSHGTADLFEEPLSEMEQWLSGFSGSDNAVTSDDMDPSSERWLADCLIDANPCSEDAQVNINPADASDVLIDITDLCDTPPEIEDDAVQAPPVRTRQNVVFKGKKSYMKTPKRMATAVVSPFDIIRPGSFEGKMTLKDINQRILNPASKLKKDKNEQCGAGAYPTSAVSGRPIIGKTKIHTEGGKGSITILKTKGP